MTIATNAPIVVSGIGNSGGNFEIQTASHHGLSTGDTVTIVGCRSATGAFIAGLNTTAIVTVVDVSHFTIPVTYASGYSIGGGVWRKSAEVSSAELTSFDASLAIRVADKTGDTLSGQYTLEGAPGVAVSGAGSSVLTEVAGAEVVFLSGSGEAVLGDGDDWQLLPPRSRSIFVAGAEVMNQYGDENIVLAFGNAGVQASIGSASPEPFYIPLTRLHDGAALVAVTLFFQPFELPFGTSTVFVPPTITPTLQVFRINPSTDLVATSLAANGAAVFPAPGSYGSYSLTPGLPATGGVLATFTILDSEVQISAGQILTDSANNVFQVTTGGNYSAGDPVPVSAVAPSSGLFYGANTNHAQGDALTWANPPSGLGPTATVASGGLSGGLSPGYAQKLVFTPDQSKATIDQSTYVYFLLITDDNSGVTNGNVVVTTTYNGVRLDFADITSLAPQ